MAGATTPRKTISRLIEMRLRAITAAESLEELYHEYAASEGAIDTLHWLGRISTKRRAEAGYALVTAASRRQDDIEREGA